MIDIFKVMNFCYLYKLDELFIEVASGNKITSDKSSLLVKTERVLLFRLNFFLIN